MQVRWQVCLLGPLDVADAVAIDLAYKVMKQTLADDGLTFDEAEAQGKLPNSGKIVRKFVEELEPIW